MLGHKTGVAKRIQEVQPKAHATHCHGHSLSLIAPKYNGHSKRSRNPHKIFSKTGDIKENLDEQPATGGVISLCPTRWTVRASCFHRIIDNYSALLQEWIVCLDQKLQADVRGRIIGCQAQMNTFDFFFGLHLGE
ncbi:unnamed protein product, partial [Porites evermanni]